MKNKDNFYKPVKHDRFEVSTAILIDGGFYRARAKLLAGDKTPKERANELERYCLDHLHDKYENRYLYRIFYYDCSPLPKGYSIYHPLLQRSTNLWRDNKSEWMASFLDELRHRRKFALRLGRLNQNKVHYNLKPETTEKLLRKEISVDDLTEKDFQINNLMQKGVDMRIGVDISSMAFKNQVNQIILIAGDSDFVPAAKQARREGIDFILDPMRNHINEDLHEHIDGVRTKKLIRTSSDDSTIK